MNKFNYHYLILGALFCVHFFSDPSHGIDVKCPAATDYPLKAESAIPGEYFQYMETNRPLDPLFKMNFSDKRTDGWYEIDCSYRNGKLSILIMRKDKYSCSQSSPDTVNCSVLN